MALKENTISYVGLKDLEEEDQNLIIKLTEENFPKIQRLAKNKIELVVHVKKYREKGHVAKWSIHVKASIPGHVFDSTKASDWDLARTMHKAFDDIKKQIEHKLKVESKLKPFKTKTIRRPLFLKFLGKKL